jgi:FkbM family methyltransferase
MKKINICLEEKTVVCVLMGGIGNQLFQYAFGKSVAAALGWEIVFDTSFYDRDTYKNKQIVSLITRNERFLHGEMFQVEGMYGLSEGQIRGLNQLPTVPSEVKALKLDGYWQGESYFDKRIGLELYNGIEEHAKSVPAVKTLANRIENERHALALHIRRHEYEHMGLCDPNYYLGAIENISQSKSGVKFFVFTDQPNFSRYLLTAAKVNFEVVESGSDIGDLYLISRCRDFILSNSSYSWWGAWFGEQLSSKRNLSQSTIIAPKEWVTVDETPSPCPDHWILVPNSVRQFTIDSAGISGKRREVHKLRFESAIRRWFEDNGDNTLRVNFPELGSESVVFDVGGYKGDWSDILLKKYQCKLHIFEPASEFYSNIKNRFSNEIGVSAHRMGIGKNNTEFELKLCADGSGKFANGPSETAIIKNVSEFFTEQKITKVDLMKINIEGGEYELLDALISYGLIGMVKRIQVQFHDFFEDASEMRASITEKLTRTHFRSWSYYFVWEEWVINA